MLSKPLFNVEIGQRIRIARHQAEVDQLTLAKAIGYKSANAVHMMEVGAKLIRAVDLAEIANFLGCTIRSLYPKGSVR